MAKHTGFNSNIWYILSLEIRVLTAAIWVCMAFWGHFQNVGCRKWRKAQNRIFCNSTSNWYRFALFPCRYMFWGVIQFNSLRPSDTIWWQIYVNIGSSNDLLPDGTKPLPQPMLTSSEGSSGVLVRSISYELLKNQIHEVSLKIALLKSFPFLPGPNELIYYGRYN